MSEAKERQSAFGERLSSIHEAEAQAEAEVEKEKFLKLAALYEEEEYRRSRTLLSKMQQKFEKSNDEVLKSLNRRSEIDEEFEVDC